MNTTDTKIVFLPELQAYVRVDWGCIFTLVDNGQVVLTMKYDLDYDGYLMTRHANIGEHKDVLNWFFSEVCGFSLRQLAGRDNVLLDWRPIDSWLDSATV